MEIIKYKEENVNLKLQVFQFQDNSSESPNSYNRQFYNSGSSNFMTSQEKERRIVELEQEVYNLTNQLAEKD